MKKRILVVDDSKIFLETMIAYLFAAGYKDILCAETGKEGLEKVKSKRPDLVILDIMLPDLLGFEVCKRIKSLTDNLSKVILITGSVDAVDSRQARLAGADLFTVKTSDNSLMNKVSELMEVCENN